MMNERNSSIRKANVRQMAIIGVLSAISIMLSVTPLGFIPIGPTSATIMHIPVIIGAIMEGPVVGMTIGFIFGASSLIRALTVPTLTSFVLLNPLVSIVPRILIGLTAYYVFKMCIKLTNNNYISGWITGVVGSLVNTIGVLGMVYILYGDRYAQAFIEATGQAAKATKALIASIALTNGIPEAIVGGLIVSSVCAVMYKRKK